MYMQHDFRPELEGLRALAVALVIGQHAFVAPRAGWIGVDVFFVLSGYLITRGLVGELGRTGSVDYPAFIARRARRILPASIVVIVVVAIAAFVVWYTPRSVSIAQDAAASLLSVQNWHLIATGTSYFAEGSPVSPLQHFWSLAVEEQFYAFWPIAVLVAAQVLRGRIAPERVVLLLAIATVAVSATWSVLRLDRTDAYFDPGVRAWELAAGAALAAGGVALRGVVASVAVVVGGATIILTAVLMPAHVSNPFPWVAPAAFGTVLVIAGGRSASAAVTAPLRWGPVRYVGRISFSLYLWHFPVLVVGRALFPTAPLTDAALVGLALIAAIGSHRWVERPFLEGRRGPHGSAVTVSGQRACERSLRRVASVCTVPLLVAATVGQVAVPAASDQAAAARAVGLAVERMPGRAATGVEIIEGLHTSPTRTEAAAAFDSASTIQFAPEMSSTTGCRNELSTPLRHARTCDSGPSDAAHTAVVIGDSIAMSWMPAVRGALEPEGWRVRGIGFASCSPSSAGRTPTREGDRLCAGARERMLEEVERVHPDLVIVSNDEQAFTRSIGADPVSAATNWEWRTRALVTDLALVADRVVILGAPPVGAAPAACATRFSGVEPCITAPSAEGRALVAANERATSNQEGAEVIDVVDWFCAADRCPPIAGGVLVRVDDRHLTSAYSERLSGVLRSALADGR